MIPDQTIFDVMQRNLKTDGDPDMLAVTSELMTSFDIAWVDRTQIVSNSLESYKKRHGFKVNGTGYQNDFYSIVVLSEIKREMEWAFLGHVYKSKAKIRKRIDLIRKKDIEHHQAAEEEILFWQSYL